MDGRSGPAADVIVTMGCGDSCPIFPGKRYLDWEVGDPAGLPVAEVRPIRDELGERVQAVIRNLASRAARRPRTDGRAGSQWLPRSAVEPSPSSSALRSW